ncbi:MAG: hypothetical protein ACI308_05835 [Muribaculaceae bacterium]
MQKKLLAFCKNRQIISQPQDFTIHNEPARRLTTLAAMKEAQSGTLRNSTPLDHSSIKAMSRTRATQSE